MQSFQQAGAREALLVALSLAGFVAAPSIAQDGSRGAIYLQSYDSEARRQGEPQQVNLFTVGNQRRSSLVALPDGGFVVLWEDAGQDPSGLGVFGQRFDEGRLRIGDEFQVNTFTRGNQQLASAAVDADGNMLVVWQAGNSQDGSDAGIVGQRFDEAGDIDGEAFQVNLFTEKAQGSPFVADTANGDFVVVWVSEEQDGGSNGIFGRRFPAPDRAEKREFLVNSYTVGNQRRATIAALADGGSVVAWDTTGADGSSRAVVAQLYDDRGRVVGTELVVNTYVTGAQRQSTIAGSPTGGFLIAWESPDQDGSGVGVFARLFAAQGVPLTDDFQVASYTLGDQDRPSAATNVAGDSLVVWESAGQDGQDSAVFGRLYDSLARRIGSEFQVNTFTRGGQSYPSVAALADGGFIVAWESRLRCAGDCDGNGIVTIDELVRVVDAALREAPADPCEVDRNLDGILTVDEVIGAVASLLESCANA
jgi:hypothetical protein